jgi:diguanylate cyclase (GGDEF)-like protein/PAS domain S-box-containing protein
VQYSTLPNDLLRHMAPAGLLPRTLKSRMTTVVILLVLGATTIVTSVALMLAERDMKAVIGAQQYAVLSTAASYVDEQLEAKRALLSTLPEGLPPGIHSDPAALQALLLARPAVSAEFFNVVAFDRSGKLVATLRPDLKEAGVDAAGLPYFDQTVARRTGLISAPFLSRLSGRPVVLMTQPVLDPRGEVAYVIAAGIDLQQSDFFGPINGLKPGKTGFMFIMTAGGILLHHPTPERLLRNINDRPGYNRATEMALNGFEGWTEAKNKDGNEGIYSYKRLKATDWIVAARYPTDEAFAPLIELRKQAILAASVFAAVAGLVAWLAIERLLAPLERLRARVALLRQGDTDIASLRTGRLDEIGELSEAFYHLTAERAATQERVLASETLVRSILEHAPDAFVSTGPDGTVTEWNAQAEQTFGWRREEALGRNVAELIVPPRMRSAHALGIMRLAAGRSAPDGMAGQRRLQRTRIAAQHRDGHEIPVELSIGTLRHDSGMIATAFLHDISERVAHEERIAASEHHARMIADSMPALVAYLDRDLRYRFTNDYYQVLLGLDPAAMLGKSISDVFGPAVYLNWKDQMAAALRGERVHEERDSVQMGRALHLMTDLVPDVDASGQVHGIYLMSMDITQRRNAELTQAASEKRLQLITDHVPALISYIDREHVLRFGNATFQHWLGLDPASLAGRPLRDVMGTAAYGKTLPHLARAFTGQRVCFEHRARLHGDLRTLETTFVPDERSDGGVAGVYALTQDMSRIKAVEQQLIELARVDALTGIANRRKFEEVLQQAMARSQRLARRMALAYLDIDNFKTINDSLGHGAGDDVLKEFASRLIQSVRAVDLVARLAGDEFIIVLENVDQGGEAAQLAAKIVHAVRAPFTVNGSPMQVTTSIGVALYKGGSEGVGETASSLIARADRALYDAKRNGRDCYVVDAEQS